MAYEQVGKTACGYPVEWDRRDGRVRVQIWNVFSGTWYEMRLAAASPVVALELADVWAQRR